MNIHNIHLIYDYNYWATGKILEASKRVTKEQFLAPAAFPFGGLRGTLVHILDAECGWRGAFENKSFGADLNPDNFPTLKSLEERWREEANAMRAYLANLRDDDMESHLRFTTDTGIVRDRILWQCLYHVVNHGTQHRSEAAALLTDFGNSPGNLDFIFFLNRFSYMMNAQIRSAIKPGITVLVVLKKDQNSDKLTMGIVKDILTKSPNHPHGIKVRLIDGQVGRVKEIVEKQAKRL